MKVELKKWTMEDAKALIKICNEVDRSYLTGRLPYPYTEKSAEWWLNMVAEREGKSGLFRAVVADGEIVGNITIEQKEDVYCKDAELGYLLSTDRWNQGIMTEATKQMCELAFRELDIVRISSQVYAPNKASQKVLEKNGFVLEGTMKSAVYKNGNIWDLKIYGLLKSSTYEEQMMR